MKLNMVALKKLIKEKFDDNQTLFANAIKIDRTHVNRIINSNGKGAGNLVYSAIIKFCKKNNLDYSDYIFLE